MTEPKRPAPTAEPASSRDLLGAPSLGRALAGMFGGYPIGSAIAGFVAARSIELAVALGVVACVVAGFLAWRLIPERGSET